MCVPVIDKCWEGMLLLHVVQSGNQHKGDVNQLCEPKCGCEGSVNWGLTWTSLSTVLMRSL